MNSRYKPVLPPDWASKIIVIYDGQCPFCSQFVILQRLRSALGNLTLVDARQHPAIVADFAAAGMPLDDGMVLAMRGDIYYGAECLTRLALMSSKSGIFNRINALMFRSSLVSRCLYPILKAGRRLTLTLMGKSRLDSLMR